MTSMHNAAQLAAVDPRAGRALHLTSCIRGRLDMLEAAIASQDARARLRVSVELGSLVEELLQITYYGEAL